MAEIRYKETITIDKTIIVDDRLYNFECSAYTIANIIAKYKLSNWGDDIFNENNFDVRNTVEAINEAFDRADQILEVIRKRYNV